MTHASADRVRKDIVCLGELLVDFVSTSTGPLRAAPGFVKAAGGAPANVAVAAARLGLSSAFIGAVGDDEFGRFLVGELTTNGVDVSGVLISAEGSTPLAFVSLREDAERDFLFYWRGTADQVMKPRQLRLDVIRQARIFHFGTISLIHKPTRAVTQNALRSAAEHGLFVSCDPNIRLPLWSSSSAARRTILSAIEPVDLLKLNEEELEFLTGHSEVAKGLRSLSGCCDALVLVTRGPRGAAYRWRRMWGEVPGFKVAAVDSTGAGDGFMAGFLACLLEGAADLKSLHPDGEAIVRWVRFANAVGALTTTRRGAIPSFPTRTEVSSLLEKTVRAEPATA
jgi:fructokinase